MPSAGVEVAARVATAAAAAKLTGFTSRAAPRLTTPSSGGRLARQDAPLVCPALLPSTPGFRPAAWWSTGLVASGRLTTGALVCGGAAWFEPLSPSTGLPVGEEASTAAVCVVAGGPAWPAPPAPAVVGGPVLTGVGAGAVAGAGATAPDPAQAGAAAGAGVPVPDAAGNGGVVEAVDVGALDVPLGHDGGVVVGGVVVGGVVDGGVVDGGVVVGGVVVGGVVVGGVVVGGVVDGGVVVGGVVDGGVVVGGVVVVPGVDTTRDATAVPPEEAATPAAADSAVPNSPTITATVATATESECLPDLVVPCLAEVLMCQRPRVT